MKAVNGHVHGARGVADQYDTACLDAVDLVGPAAPEIMRRGVGEEKVPERESVSFRWRDDYEPAMNDCGDLVVLEHGD